MPERPSRPHAVSLTIVAIACWLPLSSGSALADQLAEDYSQLKQARRSLEVERQRYESRLKEESARSNAQRISWNSCIGSIAYPVKVCWEKPSSDAGSRERELERQLGVLEAKRVALEGERIALERRRLDIEAQFSSQSRGAAYEAEFRAYMTDVTAYLDQVREQLLPQYDAYLQQMVGYVGFLGEQANACATVKPCEFAERYDSLSSRQQDVRRQRAAFERRLQTSVPAMLSAATGLWKQYTSKPRDANTMEEDRDTLEALNTTRVDLEEQRRELERQRAAFAAERGRLERARSQLEMAASAGHRGDEYQQNLIDGYIDPMTTLLENEGTLFANYQCYEYAMVAYVQAVKGAVERDPDMRQIAADRFSRFVSDSGFVEVREGARSGGLAACGASGVPGDEPAAAPAPPPALAAAPAKEQTGMSETFERLMTGYVDALRRQLRSLRQTVRG